MNNNDIKTYVLFKVEEDYLKPLFDNTTYPYEILPLIKDFIRSILKSGLDGFKYYKEDVLIGEGVSISDTATIIGPTIIGHNTEIRPGAYIRGSVIVGNNCVIGNSTEIKNSVLLNKVQVPHYNYVGDSILGTHAHLGAGVILSNLKADNKKVILHTDEGLDTGLRKVGSFLGANTDIGCNSVLNPGTVIGENSRVYPLSSVRGCYPANKIIKSKDNVCDIKTDGN